MQNFMKVPFKMPEIFPNKLGGGLEIWASIFHQFRYSLAFRAVKYMSDNSLDSSCKYIMSYNEDDNDLCSMKY